MAASVLLSGCGSSPTSPTLTNTFESDAALAQTVLDGFARKDVEALLQLAVTRDEFEEVVWPTLPVSRPEVGMPLDYVWRDTSSKSRNYLAQSLAEHGGKRLTLERIEFRGATTSHPTYEISRKAQLVVTDADGTARTLRLFGSIIRQHGRSKVFSYIVD